MPAIVAAWKEKGIIKKDKILVTISNDCFPVYVPIKQLEKRKVATKMAVKASVKASPVKKSNISTLREEAIELGIDAEDVETMNLADLKEAIAAIKGDGPAEVKPAPRRGRPKAKPVVEDEDEEEEPAPVKRGRGRPPKVVEEAKPVKRGRGRPPKVAPVVEDEEEDEAPVKRGRGRPPKVAAKPIPAKKTAVAKAPVKKVAAKKVAKDEDEENPFREGSIMYDATNFVLQGGMISRLAVKLAKGHEFTNRVPEKAGIPPEDCAAFYLRKAARRLINMGAPITIEGRGETAKVVID
jgi:hypothetical protein